MNVLSLPVEVIEGHLLPFLKWNDLLRLRRVCKLTQAITNDYLKIHPELAPEIEIDRETKNFGAFLEMNIPTTKVFLNNVSGREFYVKNEQDIERFLEEHGPVLKSLRVVQLSVHAYGKELNFLNSLCNLKTLIVGHFGYENEDKSTLAKTAGSSLEDAIRRVKIEDGSGDSNPLKVVRQLTVLKIGRQNRTKYWARKHIDSTAFWYAASASNLEHVSLPFTLQNQVMDRLSAPEELRQPKFSLFHVFNLFTKLIEDRAAAGELNLKTIDFINFHDPQIASDVHWAASLAFLKLCRVCRSNGVKLLNVSSRWCSFREISEYGSIYLGTPIVSLVDLYPWMVQMDLLNLEKVKIRATSQCSVGRDWRPYFLQWPALKFLDVSMDSQRSEYYSILDHRDGRSYSVPSAPTLSLFEFLFYVRRSELAELRLNFTKDIGVEIPQARAIVFACDNLKRLTIVKWPGSNQALTKLWTGLPRLEAVSLEYCKGLEDAAFLGDDVTEPAFLKLTKLRKLSLKGLDKMPKITDALFKWVIRHLKLSHLKLTSKLPVKSVTLSGIQSLLDGDFAESVEKFEFQRWSLEGVSTEEFNELGKKFRSDDML